MITKNKRLTWIHEKVKGILSYIDMWEAYHGDATLFGYIVPAKTKEGHYCAVWCEPSKGGQWMALPFFNFDAAKNTIEAKFRAEAKHLQLGGE